MTKKKVDIIPYESHLVEKARKLRNNSTPAEKRLWKYLRKKQMHQYDFDRQKPINRYIVDFYCKELKLAIEIDGRYHDYQQKYDLSRQRKLESFGIHFLRLSEKDVLNDIDNVLHVIEQWVLKHKD